MWSDSPESGSVRCFVTDAKARERPSLPDSGESGSDPIHNAKTPGWLNRPGVFCDYVLP